MSQRSAGACTRCTRANAFPVIKYCITSHCIALHCIILHCITLYGMVLFCISSNRNHKIDLNTINLILKHLVFRTRLKAIAPNRYTLYVSSNVLVARRASKKRTFFTTALYRCIRYIYLLYVWQEHLQYI